MDGYQPGLWVPTWIVDGPTWIMYPNLYSRWGKTRIMDLDYGWDPTWMMVRGQPGLWIGHNLDYGRGLTWINNGWGSTWTMDEAQPGSCACNGECMKTQGMVLE